ncbi:hypothetical protein BKI52_16335 [marine bacterium AO1-C]|nr:hypothetical protein BKI52_16335 [marine bacterium AO1-C]
MNKTLLDYWANRMPKEIFQGHFSAINSVQPTTGLTHQVKLHDNLIGGMVLKGHLLITASEDGKILCYDTQQQKILSDNTIELDYAINHLALSPDEQYLAAATDGRYVAIINTERWTEDARFRQEDYISKAVFYNDNQVISVSKDSTIKVWSLDTGREVTTLTEHEQWVYALAVHPTQPLLLSAAVDYGLYLWDLDQQQLKKKIVEPSFIAFMGDLTLGSNDSEIGNKEAIDCILWLNNGRVCTCAQEIVVWDEETWEIVWQSPALPTEIRSAVYWEEKDLLITVSSSIDGWDINTGKQVFSEGGINNTPMYSSFLKEGILYTGNESGEVCIWELTSFINKRTKIAHKDSIWNYKWVYDQQLLLTGSFDHTAILWTKDGMPLKCFDGFADGVHVSDVNPHDKSLVALCSRGQLAVVDVQAQEVIHKISIDKPDIDLKHCCWVNSEELIVYDLSYRPRLVNLNTKEIKVLDLKYTFNGHFEAGEGQVFFVTYPGRPLDMTNKEDASILFDIGAEPRKKIDRIYSPLVLFDLKSKKIVKELWEKPKLPRIDKVYPQRLISLTNDELLIVYYGYGLVKWDLTHHKAKVLIQTNDMEYAFGPFRHDGAWHYIEYTSDQAHSFVPEKRKKETWTFPHANKKRICRAPNGDIYYQAEQMLYGYDLSSKELFFKAPLGQEEINTIEIIDQRLVIKLKSGKLALFDLLPLTHKNDLRLSSKAKKPNKVAKPPKKTVKVEVDKNAVQTKIESWDAKQIREALALLKNDPVLAKEVQKKYEKVYTILGGKTINSLANFANKWEKLSQPKKIELLKHWPTEVEFPTSVLNLNGRKQVNAWRESNYSKQVNGFPANLAQIKGIKEVHLRHQQLTELPDFVLKYEALEVLDLEDNDLDILPEELLQLKHLRVLNTNLNYGLATVPDLSKFKQLEELYIEYTKLDSLPEAFFKLPNIRVLYTQNSTLDKDTSIIRQMMQAFPQAEITSRSLEAVALEDSTDEDEYKGCEKITIDDYNLNKLPVHLFKADKVKELIIDCRHVKEIPDELENLQTLEVLHLKISDLKSLPLPVTTLKNLKELHLDCWRLEEFPAEIAHLSSLRKLVNKGHGVKNISSHIFALQNLTHLEIHNIHTLHLPQEIGQLTHLKTLILESCRYVTVDAAIQKLKNLEILEMRSMETLQNPEVLYHLPKSIKRLDLKRFSSTTTYPVYLEKLLSHLPQLQKVYLDNVTILHDNHHIPENHPLITLYIAGTINSIPDSFSHLTKLQHLYLLDSQLQELNEALYACTELHYCCIREYQFDTVPVGIGRLKKLKYLGLTYGNIKELPDDVFELSNLEQLYLGESTLYRNQSYKAKIKRKIKGLKVYKNEPYIGIH